MAWFKAALTSIAMLFVVSDPARSETLLIMFEEIGCPYCEQWHEEVGVIYDKTTEAQVAQLIVQELDDPLPEGVVVGAEPYYTPTFVLVDDGREVGRIEGYPGEDLFWGMLGLIMARLPDIPENS